MRTTCCFLVVFACVAAASASVPVAGSGDVDEDGRLTTRDAVAILQALGSEHLPLLTVFRSACDVTGDGACTSDDAYAILSRVIADYGDFDGDGVTNAQDCDEWDERIATPSTFFVDLDRDSYGDPARPVSICAIAPPSPAVVWADDPDDTSAFRVHRAAPRNGRLLGADFSDPAQDGQWRGDLARESGVEVTPLRLTWSGLETAAGSFTGPQVAALDIANALYAAEGLQVSLTVSPMAGLALTVPDDLRTPIEQGHLRLNDAIVIARFQQMLAWLHERAPQLHLASLQLGYDIDLFLVKSPLYFWSDYGEFLAATAPYARALWGGGLHVGFVATHRGLLSDTSGPLLRSLNGLTDHVSVEYLPRAADYTAIDPRGVGADVERLVVLYAPKPVYFEAIGYPSAARLGSSPTKQSQFLRAFFDVWDTWSAQIPLAMLARLNDISPARAQFAALGSGGDLARGTAYQASLGLREWDHSGQAKAAYQTLRNLAFARGWWREPLPPTRSFDMGFTPALYDFPTDSVAFQRMLAWLQQTISSDATMVNLHFDTGVPWVEALADNFTSDAPPYSPALLSTWASTKMRVPAGKRLLVSINPLGVPRNVLAPYFGVGQGFTYDDQFRRVPDGIVRDAENRIPPAPWDTYALDDEPVKQAFFNFSKRVVQYFAPDDLILAIEITATMNEDPTTYGRLLKLLADLRTRLAGDPLTAHLRLGVSISATTFMRDEEGVPFKYEDQPPLKRALQVQGLRDVAGAVDFLGLSLYPHYGKYNASEMPASMFDSLMPLLEEIGKPVVVSETGWPADTYTVLGVPFFGDALEQEAYYRLLFYEVDKTRASVDAIVSFAPRDSDLGWQRLLEASRQVPPTISPQFVEFYKYFRDIGLYDGDGVPRPSAETWHLHLALPQVAKQP